MPFQPINFANIAPQGNPALKDFIDNLAGGYKSGQLHAQMQRKTQEEELANALQQFKLEHAPEQFDLDRRSKEAQIANALSLVNQRQGGQSGGRPLTNPIITSNQRIIQGVDSSLPSIRALQESVIKGDVPGQGIMKWIKRDRQATYEADVADPLDTLLSALNLPKIESSIKKVEAMLNRSAGESDENYLRKLKTLEKKLLSRRQNAMAVLATGQISQPSSIGGDSGGNYDDSSEKDDDSSYSMEILTYNPKTGGFE